MPRWYHMTYIRLSIPVPAHWRTFFEGSGDSSVLLQHYTYTRSSMFVLSCSHPWTEGYGRNMAPPSITALYNVKIGCTQAMLGGWVSPLGALAASPKSGGSLPRHVTQVHACFKCLVQIGALLIFSYLLYR
jgi:hypothetical protein